MTQATRLLIYSTEFPPYRGGIATFADAAARGLTQLGADVRVLAPAYGSGDSDWDRCASYPVERIPEACRNRSIVRGALLGALASFEPDALLLGSGKAISDAARLGLIPVPTYLYVHGTEVVSRGAANSGFSERESFVRLCRRAAGILANSRHTADLCLEHLPDCPKPQVVPLGIDLERFADREAGATVAPPTPQSTGPTLLCVSRLYPGKGHDILIPAWVDVRSRYPAARLRIAGDGPSRLELETLVETLGLTDCVQFLGEISEMQLACEYQSCDAFAMISRRGLDEGFGLVYLEANLFGKPVIAGRTGGVPDAVLDGVTGLLIDPLDVGAVAFAIQTLFGDPDRARSMGAAGSRRVQTEFTHLSMAQRLLAKLPEASQRGRTRIRQWAGRRRFVMGFQASCRDFLRRCRLSTAGDRLTAK